MSLEEMGKSNDKVGVCGFTSCLYAFYNKNPGPNTTDDPDGLSTLANSKTGFIRLVAGYLQDLQQRNAALATEIEVFTRTFGNEFATFSIANYVRRAQTLDQRPIVCSQDFSAFSVAMTPRGVIDFLNVKCGLRNARTRPVHYIPRVRGRRAPPRECIIGLSGQGPAAQYRGLAHWVYKRDQTIYSWGKIFAHTNYQGHKDFKGLGPPCYYIALR